MEKSNLSLKEKVYSFILNHSSYIARLTISLLCITFFYRHYGRNPAEDIKLVLEYWPLLIMGFLTFSIVTFIMGYRWIFSLRLIDENISLTRKDKFNVMRVFYISQFTGLISIGYIGTDAVRLNFIREYFGQKNIIEVGKVLFKERVISLLALGYIAFQAWIAMVVNFESRSLLVFLILIAIPFIFTFLFSRSKALFLSLFTVSLIGHLVKLIYLWCLFLMFSSSANPLVSNTNSDLSLALFVESLPFSWQGMGVGQVAFSTLISSKGAEIYTFYFESKVLFKLLSGLLLFLNKRTYTNDDCSDQD